MNYEKDKVSPQYKEIKVEKEISAFESELDLCNQVTDLNNLKVEIELQLESGLIQDSVEFDSINDICMKMEIKSEVCFDEEDCANVCKTIEKGDIYIQKKEPPDGIVSDEDSCSEADYSCRICSFQSTKQSEVAAHFLKHVQKTLTSELRSYRGNERMMANGDALAGSSVSSYNMCSYKTNVEVALKKHIFFHNETRCDFCSYKSLNKGNLKRHMLCHIEKKKFSCNLCSYRVNRRDHLIDHILTHTGEKKLSCQVCSYRTNYLTNLKRHIAKHSEETRFSCALCAYKAFQKSALQRHVAQVHTKERKWQCELCSFKTNYITTLKNHVLTHSGEKSFSCKYCSYKAIRKSMLKRHAYTHTAEKPFSCKRCTYTASRRSSLKNHILKHAS